MTSWAGKNLDSHCHNPLLDTESGSLLENLLCGRTFVIILLPGIDYCMRVASREDLVPVDKWN